MMQTNMLSPDMQRCIDECLHCYRTCQETAMNHCLQMGGRHVEPQHFRLMIDCAEICRTSAHFMLGASPLHAQTCAACAVVCEACADSCEQVGDMDECARACRSCADSCRHMAGMGGVQAGSPAASVGMRGGRDADFSDQPI